MSSIRYKVLTEGTTADVKDWKRWQEGSLAKVIEVLSIPWVEQVVEARAFLLFEEVVKIHRDGYRVMPDITDQTLKCSQRLDKVYQAIENYTTVRHDIFGDTSFLEKLAASPTNYTKAKEKWWSNNYRRDAKKAKKTKKTKKTGADDQESTDDLIEVEDAEEVATPNGETESPAAAEDSEPRKAKVPAFSHCVWKNQYNPPFIIDVKRLVKDAETAQAAVIMSNGDQAAQGGSEGDDNLQEIASRDSELRESGDGNQTQTAPMRADGVDDGSSGIATQGRKRKAAVLTEPGRRTRSKAGAKKARGAGDD